MTPDQITMANALNQCTFVPGIGTKAFARFAANLAKNSPDHELTEHQADYLRTAVIRYRRQINPSVVELATNGVTA